MPPGKPFDSSNYHRVQRFIVYECCCTDPKTLYKHYCLLCIYYSIFAVSCHYILVKQDTFSFKPKVKIAVSILIKIKQVSCYAFFSLGMKPETAFLARAITPGLLVYFNRDLQRSAVLPVSLQSSTIGSNDS